MKVLFYISSIGNGGVGRVVVNLTNTLSERGQEVYVLADTSDNKFELSKNVQVVERPKDKNRLQEVVAVRRILKEVKPDVIVGIIHFFIWGYLANLGLKTPIIASDHASYENQPSFLSKLIRFHIYKLADAVTILTETDKKILGNRLKRKVVMPNPIEIPEKISLILERKNIILTAGRLDDWYVKGYDLLIEAWGKIASRYSNWELQIAGNGSDEAMGEIKRMIADVGLKEEQIKLLGFRSDLGQLMQSSKVYILSSRTEGLPMVLLEAMANGCVCVSTSIGGRGEEILGDAGIVVDNSIEGIQNGLEEALKNPQNYVELSEKAKERAVKYESGNVADMWMELFKKLKS